jgi:hypothetical protein
MCGHEEEVLLDQGGHKKCRLCGNEAMRRLNFGGGYNHTGQAHGRGIDRRGDKAAQT